MKNFRFKRKIYGRGRAPSTWQGRFVLVVYIGLIVWRITWYRTIALEDQRLSNSPDAGGNLLILLLPILLLTIVLLIICYTTGEKPKWQRGEKK